MNQHLNILSKIIFLFLFIYFIWWHQFSFNYELEENLHYYFFVFSLLCVAGFICSLLSKGVVLTIGILPISFFIYICYLYYISYASNEHAFCILSLLLLFWVFLLEKNNLLNSSFGLLVIVLVYFIQLVLGIRQFVEDPTKDGIVTIVGSLKNSGIYCIFLVTVYPIIYYCFFYHDFSDIDKFKLYKSSPRYTSLVKLFLFILQTFLLIFIIFLAKSRAALLVLLIVLIAIVLECFIKKITYLIKRRSLMIIFLSIISVPGYFFLNHLYHIKRMSSVGRLLIWDISLSNWAEDFWFGIGLGRFSYYYPLWQARYFETAIRPSDDFFLSAGESFMSFNEFLTVFKETGLLIFIIVMVFLFILVTAKTDRCYSKLIFSLKLSIVATLVSALFSYPLHSLPILFIFGFCIITVSKLDSRHLWTKYSKKVGKNVSIICYLILLCCIGAILSKSINKAATIYKWHSLTDKVYQMDAKEVSGIFEELNKVIGDDPKFLIYRSGYYMLSDNYQGVINDLNKSKKYISNARVYEDLGITYMKTKNYGNAILCFKFLSNLIPNRFRYKLNLLRAYEKNNNVVLAIQTGNFILKMPVKVPSFEVDQIKKEAASYLASHK